MLKTLDTKGSMVLEKFYQISEVDDSAHVVYGIATAEAVDCANEICDYEDTVPLYKEWSEGTAAVTAAAGQDPSYGNIRLQHTNEIAGKVIKVDYDDDKKQIRIAAQPLSDTIWNMVKGGFVTGFSQGGRYTYRNCSKCGTDCGKAGEYACSKCKTDVVVRYACKPSEVSFVDRPCLGTAHFLFIKSDGTKAVRKFHPGTLSKAKTKRVAGEDLSASAFAYVGDSNDTSTWKLPIKFSTDAKTKSHVRNALSRFGQTQGIPDGERGKVKAKIVAAARRHGIEVSDVNRSEEAVIMKLSFKELASRLGDVSKRFPGVEKSMYQVQMLAGVLQDLKYLSSSCRSEGAYEEDERDIVIADEVIAAMRLLVETLGSMVAEEGSELLAIAKVAATKGETQMNDVLKAARSALAGFLRKAATHHEALADHHEAMANEHKACCETCKSAMDDSGDDSQKAYHKAMMGHNKSMASLHDKLHKSHVTHCDSLTKMATAEEEAANKIDTAEVAKVAPVTVPAVAEVVKAAAAITAATTTDAAAAVGASPIQDTVNNMLGDAIKKAIEGSLTNLGSNDTIQKAVQEAVAAKVTEILGGTAVPATAKVAGLALVPRTGEVVKQATGTDDGCGL